jgi:hypothetical protein
MGNGIKMAATSLISELTITRVKTKLTTQYAIQTKLPIHYQFADVIK